MAVTVSSRRRKSALQCVTSRPQKKECIPRENRSQTQTSLKMAQREQFRAMLNARLASTGDGINALFEEKIREYEEEVNFLNEESNLRQKLLDAAMKEGMPVVLCEDEAGPAENTTASTQNKQEPTKQQQPPK